MNVKLLAGALIAVSLGLAGCVTNETKPVPKVVAKQSTVHIPDAELLAAAKRALGSGGSVLAQQVFAADAEVRAAGWAPQYLLCPEARGFVFGAPLALRLGALLAEPR